MPTYVALLRGINVGGSKKIKMEQLRRSFAELGLEDVHTYIQTGNVIFKTGDMAAVELTQRAEDKILSDFGLSVRVILRTAVELGQSIRNNPFTQRKGIQPAQLHVFFLSRVPTKTAVKELEALPAGTAELRWCGRELYLHTPDGFGRTKLPNFDKVLSVTATARNWNTVNKLYQLASEAPAAKRAGR